MNKDSCSELPSMEYLEFHIDMTKPDSFSGVYVPGEHVLLPHLLKHHDVESQWLKIEATLEHLSSSLGNSRQLEDAILSYNSEQRGIWNFDLLHHVVNHVMREEDRTQLLQVTLPNMARLALELPQLLPRPLPLLSSGHGAHVSLSQRQIASLLAHAFFCTYPMRNNPYSLFKNYPTINFNGLFCYHAGRSEEPLVAKLLCIFNYFSRVTLEHRGGVVTFTRRHLDTQHVPMWHTVQTPLNLRGFTIDPKGKIEEKGSNMLQVSFCNKKFGGGVLDSGYVQEEIRCITCPEMIVARLFTEILDHKEAFLITGVERYNSYSGYGESFRFRGDYIDSTPRDESGRRKCAVVAIDALNFSRPVNLPVPPAAHDEKEEEEENLSFLSSSMNRISNFVGTYIPNNIANNIANFYNYIIPNYYNYIVPYYNIYINPYFEYLFSKKSEKKLPILKTYTQYHTECITRELNKAFVGFKNIDKQESLTPIASGNWGCGVFKGDPLLKFILQLLAASEAGRDLKYFSFGGLTTVNRIEDLVQALHRKELTVGAMYTALCHYHLEGGDLTQYLIRKLHLIPATSVTVLE